MTKKIYYPIISKATRSTFFDYIDSIDIPQIDYFAIGFQYPDSGKSISLMSLPEWQKLFIMNEYASYDPLRRASLFSNRNLIPFEEIDYIDNFGKEIMRQRSLLGIKNGIVLMQRMSEYNYMITLGTGYNGFDSFDFIKRYHDKISFLKADLISLIQKDVNAFLLLEQKKKKIMNLFIFPSMPNNRCNTINLDIV